MSTRLPLGGGHAPAAPADTSGGRPLMGKECVYLPLRERGWLSAVDIGTHSSAWLIDVLEGGSGAAAAHSESGSLVIVGDDAMAAFPMEQGQLGGVRAGVPR